MGTTSSKIPSITVGDPIGKHNEELLRDPKTGLLPWETVRGRSVLRLWEMGEAVGRAARKVFDVVCAAASQRVKKRR